MAINTKIRTKAYVQVVIKRGHLLKTTLLILPLATKHTIAEGRIDGRGGSRLV